MDTLFFTHLLNGLLMVGIPVGLAVYLTRRFKLGWPLWWIGAATFGLSQLGHIPFNALLTQMFKVGVLPSPPQAWWPYFNPVVLGLSAGLFEELSRTAVYVWWAKDARSWRRGVLLGAGHGGAEAIFVGLLTLFTFYQMAALRNIDLSTLFPANQVQLAQQQVQAYWSASWSISLLGAVERLFAIPVQICLSVIVLQAFTRRQPGWVALAVLWHAVLDGISVYLIGIWQGLAWAPYVIEGIVGIMALISVMILFALRRPEPALEVIPSAPVPEPTQLASIQPVSLNQEINPEALDKSKFL